MHRLLPMLTVRARGLSIFRTLPQGPMLSSSAFRLASTVAGRGQAQASKATGADLVEELNRRTQPIFAFQTPYQAAHRLYLRRNRGHQLSEPEIAFLAEWSKLQGWTHRHVGQDPIVSQHDDGVRFCVKVAVVAGACLGANVNGVAGALSFGALGVPFGAYVGAYVGSFAHEYRGSSHEESASGEDRLAASMEEATVRAGRGEGSTADGAAPMATLAAPTPPGKVGSREAGSFPPPTSMAAVACAGRSSRWRWILLGAVMRTPLLSAMRVLGTGLMQGGSLGKLLGGAIVFVAAAAELKFELNDDGTRPSVPLEPQPLPRVQLLRETTIPIPKAWSTTPGSGDVSCRTYPAGERLRQVIENGLHATAHASCVGRDGTGQTRRATVCSAVHLEPPTAF